MSTQNVVKFPGKHKGDRSRNAIYTFVFSTLIGPAIAAAILGLLYAVSFVLQKGPPSVIGLKAADFPVYLATRVLDGYVWSAIPAGITAAVLAAFVYKTGTFHWLYGVIAAAVASTFMASLSGQVAKDHATAIAAIAAVTVVLGRMVLVKVKVVE